MGPEGGQVRVVSPTGAVCGAGVLIRVGSSVRVITCAHVVATATGGPLGPVLVDLPGRGWSATARPVPDSWSAAPLLASTELTTGDTPEGADFTALTVDPEHQRFPAGTGPVSLTPCGEPDGRQVFVIGYPRGTPAGLIATARLTGRGGPHPGWVQLDGLRPTGAVIERGFSGAAVWDEARRGVIGLVTAAHSVKEVKVAWMLPVEVAAGLWPPMAHSLSTASAPRCRPSSRRDQYELADALLAVPQISYDNGGSLRDELPAELRRGIRGHAYPRQQLRLIVEACMDHPDGCGMLRNAVVEIGGESQSVRTAVEILDRQCRACGHSATSRA